MDGGLEGTQQPLLQVQLMLLPSFGCMNTSVFHRVLNCWLLCVIATDWLSASSSRNHIEKECNCRLGLRCCQRCWLDQSCPYPACRRIDIKLYPQDELALAVNYFSSGQDMCRALRWAATNAGQLKQNPGWHNELCGAACIRLQLR